MQKTLLALFVFTVFCTSVFCQNNNDYKKKPAVGLHFLVNDFTTAANIRNTSLSAVLRDKKTAKIKEMSPGLALSYIQGLNNKIDFSTTLAVSFIDYPFEGSGLSGNESALLEADASIHAKLFSDRYVVNPYLSFGAGISKFRGYYGAFLPIGLGIQVNLFNEAFFMVNSQYRVKVSTTSNYHFFHSIGFVGNISGK